jgi:transcriptional regulatory protein RtcR
MATLAPGGRVTTQVVEDEICRLKGSWRTTQLQGEDSIVEEIIGPDAFQKLDRFERVQLADVLNVCRQSKNLSEAGRKLFAVSREQKRKTNDADRLRKYLNKYKIGWEEI